MVEFDGFFFCYFTRFCKNTFACRIMRIILKKKTIQRFVLADAHIDCPSVRSYFIDSAVFFILFVCRLKRWPVDSRALAYLGTATFDRKLKIINYAYLGFRKKNTKIQKNPLIRPVWQPVERIPNARRV